MVTVLSKHPHCSFRASIAASHSNFTTSPCEAAHPSKHPMGRPDPWANPARFSLEALASDWKSTLSHRHRTHEMASWRHGVMASWRHGIMAWLCHGFILGPDKPPKRLLARLWSNVSNSLKRFATFSIPSIPAPKQSKTKNNDAMLDIMVRTC